MRISRPKWSDWALWIIRFFINMVASFGALALFVENYPVQGTVVAVVCWALWVDWWESHYWLW